MSALKFEGVKVKLGDTEYVVPALPLGALKKLRSQFELIASMDTTNRVVTDEQVDAVIAIVHKAISRNYPSVKVEELEELIDFRNMESLLAAIMSVTGLEKTKGAGRGN